MTYTPVYPFEDLANAIGEDRYRVFLSDVLNNSISDSAAREVYHALLVTCAANSITLDDDCKPYMAPDFTIDPMPGHVDLGDLSTFQNNL